MSQRFQRLILIIFSLLMVSIAIMLILLNSKENISYFYTPSEIINKDTNNKNIRIGGFVEKDTFVKVSSSLFNFNITDNNHSIKVIYNGILPDLFREGQGAVIEGHMLKQNIFKATSVFAKHDENYMPASIKNELEESGYWNKNY